MITTIEKGSESAHDNFQQWRSMNLHGYLITYKSRNNAMIHKTLCINHLGDVDWKEGRKGWGSLGNATKICSELRNELTKWAGEHMSQPMKVCNRCNP